MTRRSWLAIGLLPILGCSGGYKPGETYRLTTAAPIYFDERLFREEAELSEAGTRKAEAFRVKESTKTYVNLPPGSRAKILGPVPGGAKIGIGLNSGGVTDTGFMLSADLAKAEKE